MKRNRLGYFVLGGVIVALGLAARRYAAQLSAFVASYAGDALWALMVFVGIGFLFPRWPSWRAAIVALLFSFVIEISQLFHPPWLDELRATRLGGLVLGFGFLWSDLLCYSAGVLVGWLFELLLTRKNQVTFEDIS